MKIISDILTAAGLLIFTVSASCVDSPGLYGCAAGIACAAGGILACAGYIVSGREAQRNKQRKAGFYTAGRRDRLNADVEIISL